MAVDVRDGELWIDGQRLELEHRVEAAERLPDGHVVVLYEADAEGIPNWRTFNNLVAVDGSGNLRWTARLPDTHGDSFVSLVSSEPLIAQTFSGYGCTIDPETGEIIHREFTK